jgi:hypothetical protein
MLNKRGLSQVVTTVLIILIVLAAIILIWIAVRPTIQSATEQVTADCVTLELKAAGCSFNGGATAGTCTNPADLGSGCDSDADCSGVALACDTSQPQPDGVTVTVDRFTGKGTMTGMKFFFENNAGSTILLDYFIANGNGATFPPGPNELEQVAISLDTATDLSSYEANVAPVVGNDIICPVSSYPPAPC